MNEFLIIVANTMLALLSKWYSRINHKEEADLSHDINQEILVLRLALRNYTVNPQDKFQEDLLKGSIERVKNFTDKYE